MDRYLEIHDVPRPDFLYPNGEAFLRKHGKHYVGRSHPLNLTMPWAECFSNAIALCMRYENLIYAEGVGVGGGMPYWHAWCVEEDTNLIIDPTWRTDETVIYCGIEVDTTFALKMIQMRDSVLGISDEKGESPLLKQEMLWQRQSLTLLNL